MKLKSWRSNKFMHYIRLINGIIFLFAGFHMLYVGGADLIRYVAVASDGIAITGAVSDKRVAGSKLTLKRLIQYEFVVDGQSYSYRSEIGADSFDDFSVGQSVSILYVPHNPAWSNLADFNEFLYLYFSPFAIIAGGLLLWDFHRFYQRGSGQQIFAKVINYQFSGDTLYVTIQYTNPRSGETITVTTVHDTRLDTAFDSPTGLPPIEQYIAINHYVTGDWDYLLPALQKTDLKLTAPRQFRILE
jgi:hypothetical protein